MRPARAAPGVPFVNSRYANARTFASPIIAAVLTRWYHAKPPCLKHIFRPSRVAVKVDQTSQGITVRRCNGKTVTGAHAPHRATLSPDPCERATAAFDLVGCLTRYHAPHATPRVLHIALTTRDQVHMGVANSLSGSIAAVHTNVEAAYRSILASLSRPEARPIVD